MVAQPFVAFTVLGSVRASGVETFSPRFVRENLDTSWDVSSLQRLDCRIDPEVKITEATPLDAVGSNFKVSFDDGGSGHFVPPPLTPPPSLETSCPDRDSNGCRNLWGPVGESPVTVEAAAMVPGGGLRFTYASLGYTFLLPIFQGRPSSLCHRLAPVWKDAANLLAWPCFLLHGQPVDVSHHVVRPGFRGPMTKSAPLPNVPLNKLGLGERG